MYRLIAIKETKWRVGLSVKYEPLKIGKWRVGLQLNSVHFCPSLVIMDPKILTTFVSCHVGSR